jgi:hypothetical protein
MRNALTRNVSSAVGAVMDPPDGSTIRMVSKGVRAVEVISVEDKFLLLS